MPTINGNLQETSLHADKLRGGQDGGRPAFLVLNIVQRARIGLLRRRSGYRAVRTTGGPPRGMMNADAVDDSRPPTDTTETCTGTGKGRSNGTVHSPLPDRSRSQGERTMLAPVFQCFKLLIR